MKFDPRKHFFIDSKVQGILVVRVLVYWTLTVVASCLLLIWWNLAQGNVAPSMDAIREALSRQHLESIAIVSIILLPVLLIDSVLLSNRFVGPVTRLRHSLRALAKGDEVKPLDFRNRDLWQDMAQDFNAVSVYIGLLKKQLEMASPNETLADDEERNPMALMR